MSDETTAFTGALDPSLPEADTSPGGRAPAFGFIFLSAIMGAMTIGIMVPILPSLLKQFVGGDSAVASEWNVLFATCGGLMSFFFGPILGLLSDRYGRRPVLLISLFGLGLDFLFMAFAPTLAWLFIGRLISGATSGLFSTANAYVADVTPPQDRARAFGWMGSAFGFGFLAGPAIGGLLGNYSLRLPFLVAAVITLLNAMYGLLVLPESLSPEKRIKSFDWRRANPVGSLKLLRSHPDLWRLAIVSFLVQFGQMLWPSIFVLYTSYRYNWTPMTTGLLMMAGSALGIAVQSFITGPFVKRYGERTALVTGATSMMLAMIWYGTAPTGWLYMLGMPIGVLGNLMIPGLQGLMTSHVGPSEQGQLQGANQSIIGISSVCGPVLFGLSFAWAVHHPEWHVPGIGQYLAAAIMGLAILLAMGEAKPRNHTKG
ncbi:MAG TPA: TCR/Tet family MFS transporter [Rhizomicrobium sp.]|jgi:DHA1 family tetracycline resistance protein-like MFS transporter|nr:TCR/Tet family MFS transporter [Rhizomicrobium sp.]